MVKFTDWTQNNVITIGGQEFQFYEVNSCNENITFTEELTIDQKSRNFVKTLTFELNGIDQTLIDQVEEYGLTKKSILLPPQDRLTPPPTIAILIDENEQGLIVGYDIPLKLDTISNGINEENNNISLTYKSTSQSRARDFGIRHCNLVGSAQEVIC
jgi:hypothetical protein